MPFVALTTAYVYFDRRVQDELDGEREPAELPAEIGAVRLGLAQGRTRDRPCMEEAGRRGSSEDDLPLRIAALRTLATDGV